MFCTGSYRRAIVVSLLMTLAITGGNALAQRDNRGRGDSGRGGSDSRDSGGRSFSRGGGEARSSRGDSSSRSYRGDSGQSSRSFSGQPRSQGSSQFRSSQQSDSERSTFRPSDRESFRTDQPGISSSEGRDRTPGSQRSASGDRRGLNPSNPQGQQYQTRRPSQEQVRDFLEMPSGNDDRSRNDVARRFDQQARGERDGDVNDRDSVQRDFDRDRDRDFDRDQDFVNRGDRDGGDRDYQRWRDGAWSRNRNDDHRDWSGTWRDGDRFNFARQIRNEWRGRNDYPFYASWWNGHDRWHGDRWNWWGSYALRYNRPFYWWTWATAPRLNTWVTFGWPRPYYWDYGPGEYIYYADGNVYVNGRLYQSAPVFYDRTVQIVERAPELTPEDAARMEWLPLGVFAVTRDGAAEADVLVQLAVTKDGVISGTASDQRSGMAYPIIGMVDKQSQRAVWSYNDERNLRIIMETSIYNLTQPEATGLVHHGANDARVIELVRLEHPEAGGASSATAIQELPAPLPVR